MKCEICKNEPATSLSLVPHNDNDPWKWCGQCTRDTELYYITLDQLKNQDDATRWYNHLSEKVWFGPVSQQSFLTKLDDLQWLLEEKIA